MFEKPFLEDQQQSQIDEYNSWRDEYTDAEKAELDARHEAEEEQAIDHANDMRI